MSYAPLQGDRQSRHQEADESVDVVVRSLDLSRTRDSHRQPLHLEEGVEDAGGGGAGIGVGSCGLECRRQIGGGDSVG